MVVIAAVTRKEVAEPCLVTIALACLAAVAALDLLDPSLVVDPAVVIPLVVIPLVVIP